MARKRRRALTRLAQLRITDALMEMHEAEDPPKYWEEIGLQGEEFAEVLTHEINRVARFLGFKEIV